MIDSGVKAKAIAKLKHGVPPEAISHEMEIPLLLVREWAKLEGNDLIALQSNLYAVGNVLNGEVMDPTLLDQLRTKLEKAAISVVDEIPMSLGDPIYAKSVSLCADTIAKLYMTFLSKTGDGLPEDTSTTLFESLMRD